MKTISRICVLTVVIVAASVTWAQPVMKVRNGETISYATQQEGPVALEPIVIVAARNGGFSGKLVVESTSTIKGLRASVSPLTAEGRSIPAENVRVRYAKAWDGSWKRYKPRGLDILLETSPERIPAVKGRAVGAVWVTVKTPKDAAAGLYKGLVTVEADGVPAVTVPLELTIVDWTLPDTQDYRTWVGMIQSPDTLAMEYGTPLWSQDHWLHIARSFRYMSDVGCRNVFVPIMCRTNFGNAESMVRWIKKDDGSYEHDWAIMDRYLDLAQQNLGRPKMVTFQVWELYLAERSLTRSVPFHNTEAAKEGRLALAGKGPRVTAFDPKTGETSIVYLPRFEDPASDAIWRPFFKELRRRMRERGLEETMHIGVMSDVQPSKEEAAFLQDVTGGLPWVSQAHPGRLLGKPATGNKLLQKTADVGYEAHVYKLGYQVNPDKGRHYGWRNEALVTRFARNGWPNNASFLQMHLLPEFNITGDQRGVGRLGADVWFTMKDKRGRRAGAVYQRYPEVNWRNLDIESWMLAPGSDGVLGTARLENLREGVQECEARIFIERALLDPARKRSLGDDLVDRCIELLNQRQRAMWKTVWTHQEDLDGLGLIRARNPIESLWNALSKKGKDLPGFWDGKARRMRREEAAKGRAWFEQSGWKQRNEQLFTLAGEVARNSPAGDG